MFKRLFLFSGVISFILASGLMYFWYLPNHTEEAVVTEQEAVDVALDTDSLNTTMPLE